MNNTNKLDIPLSATHFELKLDNDHDENKLVELHFELEISPEHAFQEEECITKCIAEVLNLQRSKVLFDGVDEIFKNGHYTGLFRAHIPTSTNEIENLVEIFYNSYQKKELHQIIANHSGINNPIIEIIEIYEIIVIV